MLLSPVVFITAEAVPDHGLTPQIRRISRDGMDWVRSVTFLHAPAAVPGSPGWRRQIPYQAYESRRRSSFRRAQTWPVRGAGGRAG